MSHCAAPEKVALEDEVRKRAGKIRATEEAARAAAAETGLSPDAEIAHVHRSGRQHNHTETSAYQRRAPVQPPRLAPLGQGGVRMTTTSAAAPQIRSTVRWIDCSHKLGSLPCLNHEPHDGDGRGCVHHSTSGFEDNE